MGSIFYSIMVIAEAFGKSNTSQVFDVEANAGNEFTPAYSIYENGELSKVALINFLDDKTGASDIVASITVPGGGVPGTVSVKSVEVSKKITTYTYQRLQVSCSGVRVGEQYHMGWPGMLFDDPLTLSLTLL